jgi:hypothetical protein
MTYISKRTLVIELSKNWDGSSKIGVDIVEEVRMHDRAVTEV